MSLATPLSFSGRKALTLFSIALAALCLWLFTRHNTFPFTYHPDEHTKVQQIVSGKRNFFHPLLMLTTTDLAMRLSFLERTPDHAALVGRWVSAVFSALSVVALALLAGRWAGWAGAVAAGLLLALNPLLYELAHYFKEDPALLLGVAVSFLALDIFWQNPTSRTAAFLGLGNALAISGKYLGVVVLLFTVPLLVARCRKGDGKLGTWFALGLFVPLLLINLPLFLDLPDFARGLSREMAGATGGHHGLGRDIPHAYYLARMNELTPWGVWIGLGALVLVVAWFTWKTPRPTLARWMTLLFPIFFLVLLSFSPKTAGRYLLPVQAFASFLAALSLEAWVVPKRSWPLRILSGAAVLVALGSSGLACREYMEDFSTDSRSELRQWIADKTPAQAVIAEDGRVNLEADPTWKARKVLSSDFVPDLGSLADLRAQGVTHVAVARQAYNRYLDQGLKPNAKEKADFERRAAFYRELFASGKPVWETLTGKVIYLQPGIRLYEIQPHQAN